MSATQSAPAPDETFANTIAFGFVQALASELNKGELVLPSFPDSVIRIRKVLASGREQLYSCNPFWARLDVREEEDEGVVRITLTARDMSVDIGGFLNPEDRTSFAGALRRAVALAQAGGPQPDLPATA